MASLISLEHLDTIVGDVNHSNYFLKDFQSIHHTVIAWNVWRMLSYETCFVGRWAMFQEYYLCVKYMFWKVLGIKKMIGQKKVEIN